MINLYNNNEITSLICSDDFESDIEFSNKQKVVEKCVVEIYSDSFVQNDNVFIFEKGCPIRKRLEKMGLQNSQEIYRLNLLETLVSLNQGRGYLFNTIKLNLNNSILSRNTDIQISFFKYEK